MFRALWLFAALAIATSSTAQELTYRLRYAHATPAIAAVSIELAAPQSLPAILIMPRTYPGGYAQLPYDEFVIGATAVDTDGNPLDVVKEADAPRWRVGGQP